MTIRCPKCGMPALTDPGAVSDAGRIMRCAGCETMWMARPFADAPVGASLIKRRPPVIEGQALEPLEPGQHPEAPIRAGLASGLVSAVGRIRLAVLSLGIALGVAAAALVPPAFSALSPEHGSDMQLAAAPEVRRATVTKPGYDSILVASGTSLMTASYPNPDHPVVVRTSDPVFNWRLEPSVLQVKPTPLRLVALALETGTEDRSDELLNGFDERAPGPGER